MLLIMVLGGFLLWLLGRSYSLHWRKRLGVWLSVFPHGIQTLERRLVPMPD